MNFVGSHHMQLLFPSLESNRPAEASVSGSARNGNGQSSSSSGGGGFYSQLQAAYDGANDGPQQENVGTASTVQPPTTLAVVIPALHNGSHIAQQLVSDDQAFAPTAEQPALQIQQTNLLPLTAGVGPRIVSTAAIEAPPSVQPSPESIEAVVTNVVPANIVENADSITSSVSASGENERDSAFDQPIIDLQLGQSQSEVNAIESAIADARQQDEATTRHGSSQNVDASPSEAVAPSDLIASHSHAIDGQAQLDSVSDDGAQFGTRINNSDRPDLPSIDSTLAVEETAGVDRSVESDDITADAGLASGDAANDVATLAAIAAERSSAATSGFGQTLTDDEAERPVRQAGLAQSAASLSIPGNAAAEAVAQPPAAPLDAEVSREDRQAEGQVVGRYGDGVGPNVAFAPANSRAGNAILQPAADSPITLDSSLTIDGASIAILSSEPTTATSSLRTATNTTDQAAAVSSQVSAAIDRAIETNARPLRLRLDPPELGSIAVEVRRDAGQLQIDIRFESADALRLARDGVDGLRESLAAKGIDVDADQIRMQIDIGRETKVANSNAAGDRSEGEQESSSRQQQEDDRSGGRAFNERDSSEQRRQPSRDESSSPGPNGYDSNVDEQQDVSGPRVRRVDSSSRSIDLTI